MKNAIVTGGTKGIGLGIAKMLLKEGYFVYLTFATDQVAAHSAQEELSAIGNSFSIYCVNQADNKEIHRFAQTLSDTPIHCIVCNAGTTVRKATPDLTNEEWYRTMNINVDHSKRSEYDETVVLSSMRCGFIVKDADAIAILKTA